MLERTAAIPFGETRTYGEVAAAAGSPRAFRAAGRALGANPIPIVVPCHRVLRSGGALGGYGGGLDVKRELLTLEGVLEQGLVSGPPVDDLEGVAGDRFELVQVRVAPAPIGGAGDEPVRAVVGDDQPERFIAIAITCAAPVIAEMS